MKILGIDYGQARIGLSLSDDRQSIAFAFKLIKAFHDKNKTIIAIVEAIKGQPIEAIVIGLPLLMSGKESSMSIEVRAFGEKLKEATQLPIYFWDERLTSQQVERELISHDVKRKKRAESVDLLAASVILQSYLDSKKST